MDLSRRTALVVLIGLMTILSTAGLNIYAQTTTTPPQTTNISIISTASTPPACYMSCPTNYLYGYSPTSVTVVIGINNTVVWTNNEPGTDHSVTSNAGDPATFDSPLPITSTYSFTFTTPGTYYYHCYYHAWMEGEVIVLAASTHTSTTSSTTSSSGIPEFPAEPLAIAALAIIVALAYVALRRPARIPRQALA